MNRYYVYCHCFYETNVIFYIGKGTGNRLNSKHRSKHWMETVNGKEYYTMKIRENLSQDEAISFENELLVEFQPKGNIQHISPGVKSLDYELFSKIVKYDETSPTFLRYLVDRANGAIKAGSVAGGFDSYGYGQIYIKDKIYKIHRVIMCLFTKRDIDRSLIVDHIDGNKSNNRIDNLRIADHSENAKNVNWAVSKPSNTGEKGISLRGNYYRVLWTEGRKQYEKSFGFGPRSKRTKEQALQEAIAFRNSKEISVPPSSSNLPCPHQQEEP